MWAWRPSGEPETLPLRPLGDSGGTPSAARAGHHTTREHPKELLGVSAPETGNTLGKAQHARKPLSFLAMGATLDVCRGLYGPKEGSGQAP